VIHTGPILAAKISWLLSARSSSTFGFDYRRPISTSIALTISMLIGA